MTTCFYPDTVYFFTLSEQHAGVALSALIRALEELKMVAIVRYAYDRRSNPQVGAAFPCIKQDYEVRLWTVCVYVCVYVYSLKNMGLTVHPSPTVFDVRPAAIHRRPQTVYVSFPRQQKVHSVRYSFCMSCLFKTAK